MDIMARPISVSILTFRCISVHYVHPSFPSFVSSFLPSYLPSFLLASVCRSFLFCPCPKIVNRKLGKPPTQGEVDAITECVQPTTISVNGTEGRSGAGGHEGGGNENATATAVATTPETTTTQTTTTTTTTTSVLATAAAEGAGAGTTGAAVATAKGGGATTTTGTGTGEEEAGEEEVVVATTTTTAVVTTSQSVRVKTVKRPVASMKRVMACEMVMDKLKDKVILVILVIRSF